jgi:hypothetical protein
LEGIRKWVNDTDLTNAERFVAVCYILGIASKDQVRTITGWTENQINEAIRTLRNRAEVPQGLKSDKVRLKMVENGELELSRDKLEQLKEAIERKTKEYEEAKNAWVKIIRPKVNETAFYTLGEKAVKMACNMMFEPFKNWKVSQREQVKHFVGINEILCRIRRAGEYEADWMSGKEVERDLYYFYNRHKFKGQKNQLPVRPDAYLELGEGENKRAFYIEYDTGSERGRKLRDRFYNYLKFWNTVDSEELPTREVVWVTASKPRIETIISYMNQAMNHFERDHKGASDMTLQDWPTMYVFYEGEETNFLLGKEEVKPVWGDDPIEDENE